MNTIQSSLDDWASRRTLSVSLNWIALVFVSLCPLEKKRDVNRRGLGQARAKTSALAFSNQRWIEIKQPFVCLIVTELKPYQCKLAIMWSRLKLLKFTAECFSNTNALHSMFKSVGSVTFDNGVIVISGGLD